MTHEEILERLAPVFAEVFDEMALELTEQTTANDVESWDSLTHLALINEVELEFDIKFSMKEILEMQNVGEMVEIIARQAQSA